MANVIKMVIQFRRASTADWLANKDVRPAAGEPCFDLDLHTLKIGDGINTYENLPVIGGVNATMDADGKSLVLNDGVLKLLGFDAAAVGAQPRKAADGTLEWVVPSAGVDVATLQQKIETLETKMDGTGEGSVDAKIDAKLEAFAAALTPDDGKVNTLMELINYIETHGQEALDMAADISALQDLVGETPVAEQIAAAGLKHVKYEISHKPVGTLVDYSDNEIRVMVPSDTKFEHQNSGTNADKNQYYIGFKAYAPEDAVSFKEDLAEIISDNTMYYFEGNDFAGVDAYGRKYSICWLSVAKYDEATQTWSTYGSQSSKSKYLGYYYSVEWYDANGVKIDADCIRINLSNEDCHNVVEPYYMGKVVKEVSIAGAPLDVVDNEVEIPVGAGLKASEEILVAEDGTMSLGIISWDKITQGDDELIFDGGGASA